MDARRWFTRTLALFLLTAAAGCGNADNKTDATETGSGSRTAPPATDTTPTDTTPTDTTPADTTSMDTTHTVRETVVVDGLERPWGFVFLPGGDILVTERPGRLRVVRNGALVDPPVTGLPEVWSDGQGGLLDIALHPDFANNRLIYFSYSAGTEDSQTVRVTRARYEDGALSDLLTVFEAEPYIDSGAHFGSRLALDAEGMLYVTLGERHHRENAQDPMTHPGSIIRIHDDGRVPADNPFVESPDARSEIFTIGHRNPQGLTVHPETGALWSTEHGPKGGDEVNVIRAGKNYGWPVITHGMEYDGSIVGDGITEQEGMEQPVHYWAPDSIAPAGMTFYTGDRFPNWRGDLFIGTLVGQTLVRLVLDGETVAAEEHLLEDEGMRIRDVKQGPDGYLWIVTDHNSGQLIRLEPAE